ncbi:TetR/AcrR family transcriptional regulator [Streptomyces sp. RLB1-33]|nr:TetR/AcrR family transcriptional regulator [Streptomyces sp. RLB1-33]
MRVVAKSDPTGRARLREAASELFAEHGFAATSTRSMAAAAGLSPALVTRHFGSEQGQRAAVDEYVLDRIGEQLRDLDSVEPDRGPMVSLGQVSARVFGADPVLRGYLRHVLLEDSAASAELFGRLLPSARAETERLSEVHGEQASDEEWAPFQMLPDPWAVAAGAGDAAQPGRVDVRPRGAGPPQRGQPTAPAAGLLRSAGLRRLPGLRRVL